MKTFFVDGHGDCEVLTLPKISSPKQHRYRYDPESFTHPAKMDVVLCRKIIEAYTREGETVLDPMAGIGTTLSEAVLLGRNAVGVELEGKFVKLSKKNIRLLEKLHTLAPRGKAVVIKGDSRELSRILGEKVDTAVFSPPYSKSEIAIKQGEDVYPDGRRKRRTKGEWSGYSRSRRNIGNLEYGKPVDAVVTSPPFADAEHHYKHGLKTLGKNFRGRKAWEGKERVQSEPENIGKLKYGKPVDAIVTSPPYKTANEGGGLNKNPPKTFRGVLKKHSFKLSEDPRNVDNLPYGKGVDAVITSPPYAPMGDRRNGKKIAKSLAKHDAIRGFAAGGSFRGGYGTDNAQNIGNPRKYGKVDSVIFSPPYSEALRRTGAERTFKKQVPHDYSDNKRNIGNLRHGKVDVVISSPPYSESLTGKRDVEKEIAGWNKRQSNHPRLKTLKRRTEKGSCFVTRDYSQSDKNIGNLPHGKIDAVISSPPYSESMSKGRKGYTTHPELSKTRHMGEGSSDENIGNLKHGKIDAVISSPPYSGSEVGKGIRQKRWEKIKGRKGFRGRKEWKNGTPCHYSDNPENIGNLKADTYLGAMLQVYRECLKTLKPGGKMVLVLKDFIRVKKVVRLDLDTKKLVESCGFRWVETKLFRLPSKSFWRTLYEKKYPEVDTSLLKYEFVEVFEKPLEARA